MKSFYLAKCPSAEVVIEAEDLADAKKVARDNLPESTRYEALMVCPAEKEEVLKWKGETWK